MSFKNTFAAVAAAWLAVCLQAGAAMQVGATFPSLVTMAGYERVPDLQGKVFLVDFWASWCAPCQASFPALQRLQERFRARGFEVIAVNVDTKQTAMDRFLKEHPVNFTVVRDIKQQLVELVEPEAMPTSLLIDRQGRVVAVHSGFRGEETEQALIEEIEKCLRAK